MLQGLRTVVYRVADLAHAKKWWTGVLGFGPYFDESFYVGFNVGGYELGLTPAPADGPGSTTYWGVPDIEAACERLHHLGASEREPTQEVGGGIKVATMADPDGNRFGLIENPHFSLPAAD